MATVVSDGLSEDLIRAFQQAACAEGHYKTLIEKYNSEMENGLIDVEDDDVRNAHLEKLNGAIQELNELAEIRRAMMLHVMNRYEKADKSMWCVVKHLALSEYNAFEAYQASDNNAELLNIWLSMRGRFINAVTRWLGIEVTDCVACYEDAIRAERR